MRSKNGITKRVFKTFWAWQKRAEEKWLEEMARSGWSLNKASGFMYRFRRSEPQDVVFRIDYKELSETQAGDYLQLCEDFGWEFVGRWLNWLYFRRPAEDGVSPELYTDNASRLERFRAQLRTMAIAFMPFFIFTYLLAPLTLGRVRGWWVDALQVALIAFSLFLLYCLGRLWAVVRRLESNPGE